MNLTCPKCGGHLEYDKENNILECPYCKYSKILEKKETLEEKVESARRISYAKKEGENQANADAKKKKIITTIVVIVIVVAIIIAMTIISGIIDEVAKEKVSDPFKYVEISYSGINCDAKAIITRKPTDEIDLNQIQFKLSKTDKICNGDKINIFAESQIYSFDESIKEVTVLNLSTYVTDLKEITNEIKSQLETSSYEYLKKEIENSYSYKGTISKLVPYKLYLLTDKKNKNSLCYVYKLSTKTKSKVFDTYVVARYTDFIVNSDGTYNYKQLYNIGNQIKAGDPKLNNAFGDDYVGFIRGFYTINDFKEYFKSNDFNGLTLYE